MALTNYVPNAGAKPFGLICLLLNIIPGVGTIVAGVRDGSNLVRDIVIGILQFVLTIGIIGFIWSIVWGVLIYQKSPK